MKKKTKIAFSLTFCILLCFLITIGLARFIFLSPSCFRDNDNFSETENYHIKKLLLEAVEDRCSVLSDTDSKLYDPSHSEEIVQLYSPSSSKKLFICINSDFMESFEKTSENEYVGRIQTYYLEDSFDDCIYEFHIDGSDGYRITFWGLDP